MSAEIRDWLAELRDRDPAAARATCLAIAALLDDGERRGEPLAALRALRAQVWESRRRLSALTKRGSDLVEACLALQVRYGQACFRHDLPAAAVLREVTAELERRLGTGPWPEGLSELGPGGPEDEGMRVLFAAEPPGSVLLLAVVDGPDAVRDRHLEAIGAAADVLRDVRAGGAPEATECRYGGARAFLDEFCPDDGS